MHQIGSGNQPRKKKWVDQRCTFDVTGTPTKRHAGGIGGQPAQAAPSRHQAVMAGGFNHSIVAQQNGRQDRLGRTGEKACGVTWGTGCAGRRTLAAPAGAG